MDRLGDRVKEGGGRNKLRSSSLFHLFIYSRWHSRSEINTNYAHTSGLKFAYKIWSSHFILGCYQTFTTSTLSFQLHKQATFSCYWYGTISIYTLVRRQLQVVWTHYLWPILSRDMGLASCWCRSSSSEWDRLWAIQAWCQRLMSANKPESLSPPV